ncbi:MULTISPECIES: PDZ domain-containing protein [unclassified Colwellia]|uniref:PDZ domain-containing protein n=1 Tax=unclassified Colwellia TaxID=196834 RepID=UPI0015F50FBC|nr:MULTISPECIES: PDZ domain-containing protein [unclassified Colwellia]MBA6234289.1 PDZ domain-containing protein [Colwellia sp. MB02u-7]MBA6237457.1 PDZ domain-containing protein [Colwellia sp. MB02u-11]MBA6256348.1 PDZ domain-containing protein [Colwellia sp. MB3u-28]MBA6260232.1 PDZ domain-containing protein [Colwellia sp. MB3u-41]MBA6300089.1 PDZ domain-containing protein [Colwellia sp. MB3u-22]
MQYQSRLYKKSLLVISALIFSLNIHANECAAVKITSANPQEHDVVYELVGHNGAVAEGHNKHSYFNAVLDGTKEYYLAPGLHTLTFNQWDKRYYQRFKRGLQPRFERTLPSSIQMIVEKNKRYNVAAKSSGKDNLPIFSIESIEDISSDLCDEDKVTYIASTKAREIQLNNNLDYKLKHLMAKMKTIQENNLFPLEFNWSFGAVFDTNQNSFKTLAVFPYSFASKLKLTSGDKILEINGVDVKSITSDPYSVLYGLLGELGLGHDVNMTISRAEKQHKLSNKYLPAIVPSVNYKTTDFDTVQSLTNATAIPENIKYQYNNLMVEIAEYAKNNDLDDTAIMIKSPEKYDVSFGITGKNTTIGNKSAFMVTRITENSPAENLHLKQGDIIVSINEQEFTGAASVILASNIRALEKNKVYTVSILRSGIKQVLTGIYTPILFPKFEMTVDLAERSLALNALFDLANNPMEFTKERKLRYNYGIELYDYRSSTLRTPRSHRSDASWRSSSKPSSPSKSSSSSKSSSKN